MMNEELLYDEDEDDQEQGWVGVGSIGGLKSLLVFIEVLKIEVLKIEDIAQLAIYLCIISYQLARSTCHVHHVHVPAPVASSQ